MRIDYKEHDTHDNMNTITVSLFTLLALIGAMKIYDTQSGALLYDTQTKESHLPDEMMWRLRIKDYREELSALTTKWESHNPPGIATLHLILAALYDNTDEARKMLLKLNTLTELLAVDLLHKMQHSSESQ